MADALGLGNYLLLPSSSHRKSVILSCSLAHPAGAPQSPSLKAARFCPREGALWGYCSKVPLIVILIEW